jgi:hypothetical protein
MALQHPQRQATHLSLFSPLITPTFITHLLFSMGHILKFDGVANEHHSSSQSGPKNPSGNHDCNLATTWWGHH